MGHLHRPHILIGDVLGGAFARTLVFASALVVATLCAAPPASARIFEPQANWREAGETCVASRRPPGRRWRSTPPRSCDTARRESRAELAVTATIHPMSKGRMEPAFS